MKSLLIACAAISLIATAYVGASPTATVPPRQEIVRQSKLAMKYMVYAPKPEYPVGARQRDIKDTGLFRISFDPHSGASTSVDVVQSTGNAGLDHAAIAGFRQWRCRPGALNSVVMPITFTRPSRRYPGDDV
jgi:TonB family protein